MDHADFTLSIFVAEILETQNNIYQGKHWAPWKAFQIQSYFTQTI